MADCYAPEADDLHRRWLPREIFADIGIVDTEPVLAVAVAVAVAEPPAAANVEKLAAQLADILGAGAGTGGWGKSAQKLAPPPPPSAPVAAPCHRAPVCGLEGAVFTTYGGDNAVAAGTAVAWPATPYSSVQWQVESNFANVSSALEYPRLPPAPPCRVPLGASKPRGGTGVFLPRTDAYRHAPSPAKDVMKAPSSRTWPGTVGRPVQLPQQQPRQKATAACSPEVALALPTDWSYL